MLPIQRDAALAVTDAVRGTSTDKVDGLENSDLFSEYIKVNLRSISSEYFLALAKHIIQELIIIFSYSVVSIIFSEIIFFINYHWME